MTSGTWHIMRLAMRLRMTQRDFFVHLQLDAFRTIGGFVTISNSYFIQLAQCKKENPWSLTLRI